MYAKIQFCKSLVKYRETAIVQVFNRLDDYAKPENGCILTIGNFDGVHLGHQDIINRARQLAETKSLPLVIFTFNPAPVKFLRPEKIPRLLTPLEIKIRLFEKLKVDQLVAAEPTEELLTLSAQEFTEQIIVKRLGAKHVVEGQTFNFGRHRLGTVMNLKKFGRKMGFQTHMATSHIVTLADSPSVAVSSTLIRQLIATGQLSHAEMCLGRPYSMVGRVVRGRGQGRQLGFPTANIKLHNQDQLVPEDGVFAGYAKLGDDFDQAWAAQKVYRAAVSIGRSETFTDSVWQIEAFLLNYPKDGADLHGKYILLSLVEKTRPQFRYDTVEALTRAIQADCRDIDNILQNKEKQQDELRSSDFTD